MRADARWARIDEIYHSALERPADERASFVREKCAGDDELRREIESLLDYDQKAATFLEPVTHPTLSVGQRVGCYRVISKLGRGGMGEVYTAEDTRLNRRVAIKVLPRDLAGDSARKARLVREARAASALNHPNIVTVHDIGTDDGIDFIVMEYVDGSALDQLISGRRMQLNDVLKCAVQIADALANAHRAGVIHRDLKPSNIVVARNGTVKVLDFGLAKMAPDGQPRRTAETATCTAPGMILGTAGYMSPEQAEGKALDTRSDIFSFGALLYEMVTGQRAFLRDTAISTISAILREEPKRPSELVPAVPPQLETIILRCLRKDPDRRYQHMDDVRVELLELQEQPESVSAAAPSGHSRLWLSASVGALVLLAGGLGLIKTHFASAPESRLVQITAYPGSETYPSFSPDGKQVAFSWDGENGTNPGVYVKLLGETTPLRLTTGPDTFPAWAPDGKRVAFERAAPNAGIYTVSALGGAERRLSELLPFSPMSWSPDGRWLAMHTHSEDQSGILLLPASGGAPRPISSPSAPSHDLSPGFAPDGTRLAYARCEFSCDVYVQDLDSNYLPRGVPRKITDQRIGIYTGLSWSRDARAIIYAGSKAAGYESYLWRVRADGRQPPERLLVAGSMAWSPSVSPVGDRVVFQTARWDCDIWRYREDAGSGPLIVSSLRDDTPQFSPDGTRIAFESDRSGEAGIWVAQADGSSPVQMTHGLGCCPGSPRWSPDGRWIVFDALGDRGDWDVWVMESTGASPHRITPEPSNDHTPSWSRDGKWIYFESDRSGRPEVWRVRPDGGPAEQITKRGGSTAFDSVDGKTLFYTKDDVGPLFAMPLSGGEEEQVLPYVSQRAFVPVADGIYYIGQPADRLTLDLLDIVQPLRRYPLQFFQFSSRTSTLLTNIDGVLDSGLSVSPDRKTILFSKSVTGGSDLMMLENF